MCVCVCVCVGGGGGGGEKIKRGKVGGTVDCMGRWIIGLCVLKTFFVTVVAVLRHWDIDT